MDYKVSPFSDVWANGVFTVPTLLADKYLKMASEYQLKALLYVLRSNGRAGTAEIASAVGVSDDECDELLEFWVSEGLLETDESKAHLPKNRAVSEKASFENVLPKAETVAAENAVPKTVKSKEAFSPPRLSPKDVVAIMRSDEEIRFLLTEAQRVLGRSISHAEQEMFINMVSFYGLKAEVVLMILEFYRAEKEKGRTIGISYITAMAKNWAEEGISTVYEAEEKLKDIEKSDRLWNEVTAITGVKHRRPTEKQREMVKTWFEDFDITMINLASDIMKENISEPKLSYINSILKKWKKNGIKTPEDVKESERKFEERKKGKPSDKLRSKPTYDLEQIKKDAMDNTEI